MSKRGPPEGAEGDGAASEEELVDADADGAPSPKAARMGGPWPDWPKGAVLQVRMQNFMTYTDVTVDPGPRLNLILGPNGTGKSSLVCALCVGLAGATSLLGRAKDVREYVKRGEQWACVTVTLASGDPARPLTVQRKVTCEAAAACSDYKLDGRPAKAKDVAKAVADMNIQLDNLCQFLPQDRVVEFAKMSPKELLAATESALGESELKRQHEELVAAKASIGDLEKSVAADAGRLERLRGENEALERDVARFKKREEKLALVKLQRAKLPWLHYEAARRRHDEAKAAEAEAKRQAAAKEAAAAVASAPLAAAEAEERSAAADLKPLSKAAGDADAAAIEARDAAGAAGDKVDAAAHAVAAAKKKAASRAAELASRERRLADAQAAAALAASAPPPNQAEADDVRARLRAESARAREAEAAADEARDGLRPLAAAVATLTAQLEELQRESNARLKALMARHANRGLRDGLEAARRAVAAGQLSPAGFVGPVLFEVQVREKVHANMLEQAVPQWLWAALVVTCKADHDALYSAVKAHGVSVVTHAADTGGAPRGSRGDPATLAHLGVTGTLDTVFEAPPLVRHVLCDSAGLSSTLVGTAEADGHWERLQAQHGVDLLCTPTTVYRHKRSRHDPGATTTSMKPLPPGRLFSAATSEAQRAERAAQLAAAVARERDGRAAVARLEQEVARLGAGVEALSRRREALDKAAKADAAVRRKAAAAAAALEKEVDVLRREAAAAGGGDGAAVARAEKGLAEACRAHAAAALAASRQLLRACAAVVARSPHVGRQAEARERARALRKSLEGAGAEAAKARDLAARLTAAVAADKAAARKALAVAEAAGGGPLGEAQRAQFRGLPDDADELEALIRSTLDEADAILCPNPGVVAEYAKRRAEIEALGAAHAGASARLASAQAHIDAVRAAWLPSLRALFSRISASFSAAMAAVGCAGEVGLDERGDAFADYAVVIKVKFRSSEPLMPLTAHRQSGGERSVSTMLYLIALQDLTACPFRVVDEINQGMDPVNERKIFSQMVAAASAPNTPQCFLLTPKLLPQLDYGREAGKVTVLCIFNGPRIADVARGWTPGMFTGRG